MESRSVQTSLTRDFLSGPVIKTSPSNEGGAHSIPGWGAKIPYASWQKKKKKKKIKSPQAIL